MTHVWYCTVVLPDSNVSRNARALGRTLKLASSDLDSASGQVSASSSAELGERRHSAWLRNPDL